MSTKQKIFSFVCGILLGLVLFPRIITWSDLGILEIHLLVNRCELYYIDKELLPEHTIALACLGVDLIRLWPLPIVQPWDDSPPGKPDKINDGIVAFELRVHFYNE